MSVQCLFHLSSINSPVLARQYISRAMPISLMILVHKQSRCLTENPKNWQKKILSPIQLKTSVVLKVMQGPGYRGWLFNKSQYSDRGWPPVQGQIKVSLCVVEKV